MATSVRLVWQYRELLVGLVRKELKVKYKNSALGFFWSMLNPAMYLVVFYVVFQLVLRAGIPNFAIFLLCGLLVWNLFSNSCAAAVGAITSNASLVNKVYFPREILPLAAVGANVVHFFLQATVLLGVLAAFRYAVPLQWFWIVVPALAVLLVFTAAAAVFLSAINVYARDTQHLLELALLAWFWMTPIVYHWALPARELESAGAPSWVALLNPITSVVLAFQRGIYGAVSFTPSPGNVEQLLPYESQLWYLRNLGIVGLVSVVLLVLAIKLFSRLEGNFAEEL